jgi:polygalacturonase
MFAGGFRNSAQAQGVPVPAAVLHDVRDYGARGDGKTVDSGAINAAIEAAAKAGGGTVHFPPGTYVSASIRLRSHITLHLEAGAVIEAVDWNIAPYDRPEPNEAGGNYQDFGHSHWKNSLIWGIGLENVAIPTSPCARWPTIRSSSTSARACAGRMRHRSAPSSVSTARRCSTCGR